VLVVVAVETQQLPVAAVWWIIVVVVIPVMNGEFPQFFPAEFATTPGADPGIHFERLFPVGFSRWLRLCRASATMLSCRSFSECGFFDVMASHYYCVSELN